MNEPRFNCRGEYAYVTKCLKCKKESCRPSFFYELDLALQGKKTLDDCLADFTKEEKLTGDNQYHCAGCESKQGRFNTRKMFVPSKSKGILMCT